LVNQLKTHKSQQSDLHPTVIKAQNA